MRPKLLESVPNFSEGRNTRRLEELRRLLVSERAIRLLNFSADADHNRSVATLAGSGEALVEALLKAAALAVARIDLRSHRGVHPRIGAVDVVPFIPLDGTSWEEATDAARQFADRLWSELRVPSYFYGRAAVRPDREKLESFRSKGFEALLAAPADPRWSPDIGGPNLHPTAGATAVGVRKPLIAYNVNLATSDPRPARRIARAIRESSGGFPCVKALGLELKGLGLAQVSMNLTDYEVTSPQVVFAHIVKLAAEEGIRVAGSELIGLIPRAALRDGGAEGLGLAAFNADLVLEAAVEKAFASDLPA